MARFRKQQKNGPGLLFLLVALVVVAAAGARLLGLTPVQTDDYYQWTAEVITQDISNPIVVTQPATKGKILIYHAHSTENYSPNPTHAKQGKLGDIANVARELQKHLEERGYTVTYLADSFDVPDFSGAFGSAAKKIASIVQSEDILAVVDVHRDGLPKSVGDGYTTTQLNGKPTAKLLFVVGDVSNPNQKNNLAIAQAMKDYLDRKYAGLVRGIKVQHRNINGNLHPNSLTVYVGDYHDNTLAEALNAVPPLAEALDEVLSTMSATTLAPVVTP